MVQVEIIPQSIANIKTVILKPRLDAASVSLMSEKIKINLFSKFIFKPKVEEIKLISFENYYEPYLIIGGKYSLNYFKKHSFAVNVDEKVEEIYIEGQKFQSELLDPKTTKKIVKLHGQEHALTEKETYFVLDRMMREISPEKLSFSPFELKKAKNCKLTSNFKKMSIPTETQIEFLKSRIALRPSDVAEIKREIFEVTDRTIIYVPMVQLTFENAANHKEAAALVNAITGETELLRFEKKTASRILSSPINSKIPVREPNPVQMKAETGENSPNVENKIEGSVFKNKADHDEVRENIKETVLLGFPAKISGEIFSVGDNVTAIVGDLEISSGSNINKTLVVKGSLKIGDNCRAKGNLKSLKDTIIGEDTIIDGDLVVGNNIFVGQRSIITGSIEAAGSIQISKNARVEKGLRSNSEITQPSSDIQAMVDFETATAEVDW